MIPFVKNKMADLSSVDISCSEALSYHIVFKYLLSASHRVNRSEALPVC